MSSGRCFIKVKSESRSWAHPMRCRSQNIRRSTPGFLQPVIDSASLAGTLRDGVALPDGNRDVRCRSRLCPGHGHPAPGSRIRTKRTANAIRQPAEGGAIHQTYRGGAGHRARNVPWQPIKSGVLSAERWRVPDTADPHRIVGVAHVALRSALLSSGKSICSLWSDRYSPERAQIWRDHASACGGYAHSRADSHVLRDRAIEHSSAYDCRFSRAHLCPPGSRVAVRAGGRCALVRCDSSNWVDKQPDGCIPGLDLLERCRSRHFLGGKRGGDRSTVMRHLYGRRLQSTDYAALGTGTPFRSFQNLPAQPGAGLRWDLHYRRSRTFAIRHLVVASKLCAVEQRHTRAAAGSALRTGEFPVDGFSAAIYAAAVSTGFRSCIIRVAGSPLRLCRSRMGCNRRRCSEHRVRFAQDIRLPERGVARPAVTAWNSSGTINLPRAKRT